MTESRTTQTLIIEKAIARLRQLTQQDRQALWRVSLGNGEAASQCDPSQWDAWPLATLNERQHIAWPAGQQVLWLGQVITLPDALVDYPLAGSTARLSLTWWAEQAQVYVNGQLVQEGDLFDTSARILLAEALEPGKTLAIAIRLVSPAHDAGALVRSRLLCEFLPRETSSLQRIDPGMLADELEVLLTYVGAFRPEDLDAMAQAAQAIQWECSDLAAFNASLWAFAQHLMNWSDWLKGRSIHWVGHAHLDLAWLWPVAETWVAAERTFQSVLTLQRDFDELNFCHSTPALYAWIEQHRPSLFAQIQQRVAEGRWEVAAGMWVEPELNLISGESMVRQVLYGQRYTQERFGQISRVVWLPDSFGFCTQIPQILRQGGIEYFLTQKLRWNDTTQFPHEAFWWQAPDGTRIFSIMTPPIGESIDPVKMGQHAQGWEAQTLCPDSLWLPGVGDHGGGPTRDMLEVGRRLGRSQLLPALKSSTLTAFCQQTQAKLQQAPELIPVWEDELYLEFHRGCYTSHADQKRYNRRCEHWLTEAELFSAIATLIAQTPYPKEALETAWKKVLFNQFHDILPGSSIPEVFVDADQDWEFAQQTALDLREQALEAIAAQVKLPAPPRPNAVPVIVYNSLNWERSEVVAWTMPPEVSGDCELMDASEMPIPVHYDGQTHALSFFATVPSLGYQVFWCCPGAAPTAPTINELPQHWRLENDRLRVEICPETGNIRSIRDRQAQREVLAAPGNVLQFFQDQGQYWDAWNIDPAYAQHPLEAATLVSIRWVSQNPIQQRIQVVRHWRSSQFVQDYVLDLHAPCLKIETQANWQETHVLVKAAFPTPFSADHATYEVPCGAIQRPTLPNPELSQAQQAKWEVSALHWADLTASGADDSTYGLSLLNDCKYGYDAQPNCLRLTLLRSPIWPDPDCDRAQHTFTYAVYPHSGCWQDAQTVQWGYGLNRPLLARALDQQPSPTPENPLRGDRHSFLSTPDHNLVLMALKQEESSEQAWILRFYESVGQPASGTFETTLPIQYQTRTDGLEQPTDLALGVTPWQIQSQRWS
ncbi:MAG: alpha-mannosidase [Thermosynechococcaceae cyanobacterium MS004]|nr:alpha-mannosidase [Thermosynechococcaceae cyanobacterium MS004]